MADLTRDLLRQQDELQARAEAVELNLQLSALLRPIGEPVREPDLAHLRWLPAQLSPETREAILLVKSARAARSEYGTSVTSFDIYTAVLKDGVRTRDDFEAWLAKRDQALPSCELGTS